ncbi:hypothetical protein [Verticiella sediminum]|uniref:hypothetical protein n=1 Tax=Verticiella sediminum TaxID=1247510 RepID=UPI00147879AD|nr:hypothetical protein [Verticiella sediminum]
MTLNDFTHAPLLITVGLGAPTREDLQRHTRHWNRLFDAGTPFASLRVFVDDESTQRPEGGAQDGKAWLQERGAHIRTHVWGMATVVLPQPAYERLRRMDAEKLFGVPASTFPDLGTALDWLQSAVFTPRGLSVPAEAVSSTVARLCWDADV